MYSYFAIILTNALILLLFAFDNAAAQSQLSLTPPGIDRVELAGLLVDVSNERRFQDKGKIVLDMVLNEYASDEESQRSVLASQNICRHVISDYDYSRDKDMVRLSCF